MRAEKEAELGFAVSVDRPEFATKHAQIGPARDWDIDFDRGCQ